MRARKRLAVAVCAAAVLLVPTAAWADRPDHAGERGEPGYGRDGDRYDELPGNGNGRQDNGGTPAPDAPREERPPRGTDKPAERTPAERKPAKRRSNRRETERRAPARREPAPAPRPATTQAPTPPPAETEPERERRAPDESSRSDCPAAAGARVRGDDLRSLEEICQGKAPAPRRAGNAAAAESAGLPAGALALGAAVLALALLAAGRAARP